MLLHAAAAHRCPLRDDLRPSRARFPSSLLLLLAALLVTTSSLHADPPTCPPPCNVQLGPLFCIRVTDIVQSPIEQDRWYLELEYLNWTGQPASGLIVVLNRGGLSTGALIGNGVPHFAGAEIDANGRPYGAGADVPRGNAARANNWQVVSQSPTRVHFHVNAPTQPADRILPVQAQVNGFTYRGILDPAFAGTQIADCVDLLLAMIPGSVVVPGTTPIEIAIPDFETVDDGSNALDGFVLEIDDWDPGEVVSFSWFLTDALGNNLGMVVNGGPVLGDEYGFGTLNVARGERGKGGLAATGLPSLTSGGSVPSTAGAYVAAPPIVFTANGGFDPADNTNPNADSPRYFAEDESGGLDLYPLNPIPVGKDGAGSYFHVEPGAAVTAAFFDFGDNTFSFGDLPVTSGVNLAVATPYFQRGDCNNDGAKNIADPVRLLNYLFPPTLPVVPVDCPDACDGNDDGTLNIADAVALLNVLFPTGPPVAWLDPDLCGVDPSPDTLDCFGYAQCP